MRHPYGFTLPLFFLQAGLERDVRRRPCLGWLLIDVIAHRHAASAQRQQRDDALQASIGAGNRDRNFLDPPAYPFLQQAALRNPVAIEARAAVFKPRPLQPRAGAIHVDPAHLRPLVGQTRTAVSIEQARLAIAIAIAIAVLAAAIAGASDIAFRCAPIIAFRRPRPTARRRLVGGTSSATGCSNTAPTLFRRFRAGTGTGRRLTCSGRCPTFAARPGLAGIGLRRSATAGLR
ncbi:hypothetical protein [Thermomonas sp. HDW16]|uniref:hypothetical protein n=1 Tax=Thermomonas sp. HDW16 TaxID=2714945 RepID=UPI00140D90BE|nr:hypothetical protein [Thermomonas sp. HDW16]QIL20577.1 hypothetical protein G7079_07410 [Thermomonas sp. HDW16]